MIPFWATYDVNFPECIAVAKETLRLESPTQMIRTTSGPYEIITRSGNRYLVEKDTAVLINSYQMARNPQTWLHNLSQKDF